MLNNISVKEHYIVVQAIVPFADKLNYAISVFVIGIKQFYIKRFGAYIIPLWVQEIIIYLSGEFKFAVLAAIKRRTLILGSNINTLPVVMWFNIVHIPTKSNIFGYQILKT